jgi:hypothetical protein
MEMGAEPWLYIVPYQADIEKAMHELQQREFNAGRYNPAMPFLPFPVTANSPAPGRQHSSIDEAMQDSEADGTRSILDMRAISDEPNYGVVTGLDDESLTDYYGTRRPTREMVEVNQDFFEDIERGHGIYILLYVDGKPDEILFAGYSYD